MDGLWQIACTLGLNLRLHSQKFFAPWFAAALGTFVDSMAYRKTVITLFAIVAGELLALVATPELSRFSATMLFVQHVFTGYAHGFILRRNTLSSNLPLENTCGRPL
jgi:hypothetical protein